MRTGTVSYKLEDLRKGVIIPIGMVGENDFTRVIFDAEEVFKKHPDAQVTMKVQPPKGGIYPATVTRDGNTVTWQVKAADVARRGSGELQLTFTADTMVEKSYIARTDIKRSLVGNGPAPDPVQDWVDNAEEVLEDLEAAEVHQPIIGLDGYWYTWNQETGEYEKTNTKAQGQDGHSPVLTSSKSGKTTTIFADGDQLAQILDGEDGQGADVIDDTAGEGDTDKTWSADKLDAEITDVKSGLQGMTTATAGDIGKSLSPKTVHNGKVTDWQFVEGGGESVAPVVHTVQKTLELNELTPIEFSIKASGYITYDGGGVMSSGTSSYTDYVDITGFTRLVYKRQKSTNASPAAGMAFYNKNKTFISGVQSFASQSAAGYKEYEVAIPNNAVYARFTTYTDTTTYGAFEVSGRSILSNRVTEIDTKLTNVLVNTFDRITDDEQIHSWILGGLDSVNGTNTENSAYVRTNGYVFARAGSTIDVQSGYKFTVCEYDSTKTFVKSKSATISGKYTVLSDCWIRFAIAKTDNTQQQTVAIKSNFILDIYGVGNALPEYGLIMPTTDIPTTASGVYALYDELVTAGYATRTTLDTVQGLPIYRYDFTGMDGYVYGENNIPHPGIDRLYNKYQILFSSGIHGDERGAVIYLYEWIKKMCTDPHYARFLSMFDFYVVPVVNPTGYNANTRNNYQNININRIDQSSETVEAQALMGQIDYQEYDLYIDFHNTTSDGADYQNGVCGCISVANDMPDADKVKIYRRYAISAADVLGRIQKEFGIAHSNDVQSFYPWEGTDNETFRNYGYTHESKGAKYSCCFETSRACRSYTGSTYDYNNNAQMIGNTITDKSVSDILDAIAKGIM